LQKGDAKQEKRRGGELTGTGATLVFLVGLKKKTRMGQEQSVIVTGSRNHAEGKNCGIKPASRSEVAHIRRKGKKRRPRAKELRAIT